MVRQMAKKTTTFIEYRFDTSQPWVEYTRTQVPTMVDHYLSQARREFPGAFIRPRKELKK